ncbi:hypothetical protein BJ956_000759 [Arthrobacter psychrochitiniphilus]|uniref:Uncharacterized protein n=1 Tax=Arthrobacter psychrochitiniphilus TaxID=291045 RepID=A0A2V3DYH3_9MICC|nr:hypothetical protein [Arthrobacter psychrochitiniphilus]NYG16240.1 hypothetical protein [Arthrobacter psychrochitiniphilus]PXA69580.1 hypothetical protein CVS29_03335 [Arthrobacter psychrochitiniphilus]
MVTLAVVSGLALAMLVANQAVGAKVDSLKASVGASTAVNPAESRGGRGGGTQNAVPGPPNCSTR